MSPQNGLTSSGAPIYSVMQGHEKVTRVVASNKRNGLRQVIMILSPEILSISILSVEAVDSVKVLSPTNSPASYVSHIL